MCFRKVFLLVPFFMAAHLFSQGFAANLGYAYIGKNAGYVGLDYRLDASRMKRNVGIGTQLTSVKSKFAVVPEIHYNQVFYDDFLMFETAISPKYLHPGLGINLMNTFQLKTGYVVPFDKNTGFRGLTFGVHVLLGENHFYDTFRLF